MSSSTWKPPSVMVTDASLRAAVPESRPAWWWQTRLYEQQYLKAAQRDGDRHVSTSSSTWKSPSVMVTDVSLRAAVPESRPAWWWQTCLYEQQYLKAAQRDGDRRVSMSSSTWKPPSVMVTDTSLEQQYLKAAQRDGDRHVSMRAVPESRPAWWWQTRLYEQQYLKAAQCDGDRRVSTSSRTWKPPSVMVTDMSLWAAVPESRLAWWWQTCLYEQQYLKATQRDGDDTSLRAAVPESRLAWWTDASLWAAVPESCPAWWWRHVSTSSSTWKPPSVMDRCVSTSSSTWKPPSVMWQTRLYEQQYLKAAQRDGDWRVSTSSRTWKPHSVMVTDASLWAAVPESRPAWWWQTRLYEQPYLKAAQRDGDRRVSMSSSIWKPPSVMVTDASLRAAVPESRPAWWLQTRPVVCWRLLPQIWPETWRAEETRRYRWAASRSSLPSRTSPPSSSSVLEAEDTSENTQAPVNLED